MKRWVVTILAVVSFLLAVGVCVLWIGAQRVTHHFVWVTAPKKQYQVQVFPHALVLGWYEPGPAADLLPGGSWHFWYPIDDNYTPARAPGSVLGFAAARQPDSVGGGIATRVDVPYWFLMLLTIGFPALVMVGRVRKRRRRLAGRCVACGYDLRESPRRCPECGMIVRDGERRDGPSDGSVPVPSGHVRDRES